MVWVAGRVDLQKTQVGSQVNPFLLWVKKTGFGLSIFRVGSENSDPFCHVYLQQCQMNLEAHCTSNLPSKK